MDAHFDEMLAPVGHSTADFIPASKFSGSRAGYVFQMNERGLGYYRDPLLAHRHDEEDERGVERKRKLGDISIDNKLSSDANSIEKLLEEADNSDIQMLDSESLKRLLLSFEKKISKNQKLRMKYPDEPEKFMDSEIELHDELNNLYAVAAAPELYSVFVEAGSVQSILGMVAHENTDISLAAIGLLQEVTDPETILENEDSTMMLIDALLNGQCLELIVQNLSRLDESSDEDKQGVHDTLAVIENFLEVRPSLATVVIEKTHILKFLLNRLREKVFDQNKLYCSEILSMLLQNDKKNADKLSNITGVESGLDLMLQNIAQYRKRDPDTIDERECVQNLFLALSSALLLKESQDVFRDCEGIELMLRCIKENKFAAGCAFRTIGFAVSNNRANCQKLVAAGGLRYLFPMLMGRSYPPHCKKASKRLVDSAVISTIGQLCLLLHNVSEKDVSRRLLSKFLENEHEKMDRCLELFHKYSCDVARFDEDTNLRIANLSKIADTQGPEASAAELELELLEDVDVLYAKRMENGLHSLQQLSVMIAFVCMFCHSDKTVMSNIQNKLSVDKHSLRDVQAVLREYAANITVSEDGSVEHSSLEESKRQRQSLIEWSACLAHILQS